MLLVENLRNKRHNLAGAAAEYYDDDPYGDYTYAKHSSFGFASKDVETLSSDTVRALSVKSAELVDEGDRQTSTTLGTWPSSEFDWSDEEEIPHRQGRTSAHDAPAKPTALVSKGGEETSKPLFAIIIVSVRDVAVTTWNARQHQQQRIVRVRRHGGGNRKTERSH